MRNYVSLLIVFIATSTLLALGSARAVVVGAFIDGERNDGVDARGNFNHAVKVGSSGSAAKVGNSTTDSTSGATTTAD